MVHVGDECALSSLCEQLIEGWGCYHALVVDQAELAEAR